MIDAHDEAGQRVAVFGAADPVEQKARPPRQVTVRNRLRAAWWCLTGHPVLVFMDLVEMPVLYAPVGHRPVLFVGNVIGRFSDRTADANG